MQKTIATLTFSGSFIVGGSLPDGNYTLLVDANKVHASGSKMVADRIESFHRLFGDINGNRSVSGADARAFVAAYGTVEEDEEFSEYFDVNSDGAVSGTDARAFTENYEANLAPEL